ncbi:glycogen synthase kinase binding protein [Centropristis striata]|uniref:glycogen synthase kinase binding protein n=1 Tax=Centropristis striata TaxID=184440 RepID=UPI0027E1141D|nr:glycogen synthase kinase binding protein [Centropristis striata]
MPCRKENYIFLEQSVTGSSKEVDALVTKIGEALQLHSSSQKSVSVSVACLHGGGKAAGGVDAAGGGGGGAAGGGGGARKSCVKLGGRTGGSSRASPYRIPGGSSTGTHRDWDQIRPWSRKRITVVQEEDPHRLLQELILSGNLVKEAVRRLQFPAGDFGPTADNVPS